MLNLILNVATSDGFVEWTNQNEGFFSALTSIFSLVVSITTVVITVIIAQKQYKLQKRQNKVDEFNYKLRLIETITSLKNELNLINSNLSMIFIHKRESTNQYLTPLKNYLKKEFEYEKEIVIAKNFFINERKDIIIFNAMLLKINSRLQLFNEWIEKSNSPDERTNLFNLMTEIGRLITEFEPECDTIIEIIA